MVWLPIAIRAYTEPRAKKSAKGLRTPPRDIGWPRHVLVFDTETAIDRTQHLMFGSYRFCRWTEDGAQLQCLEEGLFYADELPREDPEGFACLQDYVKTHRADVVPGCPDSIRLRSREEFAERMLYRVAYQGRALVVGFNLPFDLSRVAVDCGAGRRGFRDGFSLVLSRYRDKQTRKWKPNPYRPRIRNKHIDSMKSFIQFDKPAHRDPDDMRPTDGSAPDPRFGYQGRFLDLRTLAFSLTSRGHSLASACDDFQVEHPKSEASQHGTISREYIDYNRRDVLASAELLEKLREEFDRHPIELDPCKAYSPASLAKAYFRAMNLKPPLEKFQGVPKEVLGLAMTAFYGGRAEVRIRKTPVPVVYTDFLSMYPTIQSLMGLWDVLAAHRLEIVDATAEVQDLLDQVAMEDVFRPELWPKLRVFAEIIPDGDVLPVRARYDRSEWNVGVNPLTAEEALCYALPDLVVSKLLTGRAPRVQRAFRLVPRGRQRGLRAISLGGAVRIDPRKDNLFRAVIEERQRTKSNECLDPNERKRIEQFLKILANAGSYGVFVEMNRKELPAGRKETLSIFGRNGVFEVRSEAPEEHGILCFPPVASLITSGARLMLALLERCVADAGGSYAFADTDSMAIVASESGGLVPCEEGPHRLPNGQPAIDALFWEKVRSIVDRFEALNPYDREVVSGSILKIEDVNFDPQTHRLRPIYAYAISAKRYALFEIDSEGRPIVINRAYSEHGLGQYLKPMDPESENRDWIRSVWQGIVDEAFGGDRFDPEWADRPAAMRSNVSTPRLRKRFDRINRNRPYSKHVKPFNFLLSIAVDSIEWPPEASKASGFHLIAPYSSNPAEWRRSGWIDLHSGQEYRIKTEGHSNRAAIRVRTFGGVLDRFRDHPEAKSTGSDGVAADQKAVGVLGRADVQTLSILHIGKETNLLEQQEEGVVPFEPQVVYWSTNDWEKLRAWLGRVPLAELGRISGVSTRMLRSLRRKERMPSPLLVRAILKALDEFSRT